MEPQLEVTLSDDEGETDESTLMDEESNPHPTSLETIPKEDRCENTPEDFKAMLQTLTVDVEMSSVFVCRFCGQAFKRKYDCSQHEATSHGEFTDDEFVCMHCNRVFSTTDFLNRHVREAHPANTSASNSVASKLRMSNSDDKENATTDRLTTLNKGGFVVSYLGKPRFLFPSSNANDSKRNNGSLSSHHNRGNMKSNELPLSSSGANNNASKIKHNAVMLNLEDLCRLCGSYSERRVSIFSKVRLDILHVIEQLCPQIKVSKDDILPTQICDKCEKSISSYYQFQKDCNVAHLRFQSMLKMLMTEPDVKEKLAAKENADEEDSDYSDVDSADFDNGKKVGPTEVEIHVQPSPSNPFADLPAVDRRRIKQRLRARQRLNRLKAQPSCCPLCDKTFNLPETMRRHLATVHSNEKPYKCTLCPSSYNRNHYLTSHIKSVHCKETTSRPAGAPHLCHYCGKELSTARSLQVHINCVHTKENSYECDTCHVTFYQKISLQNHLSRNHCSTMLPKERSEFKCDEGFPKTCEMCGLEFKTQIFYTKHQMKHMTAIKCNICSEVLDTANALKDHLELEHPEMTPFQCEVCGKRFRTKNFLQKHAIIHGGEKRFECEYCHTKFLKKKYLINHVRRHTGERPFVCSVCNRAFTQVSEMRIHKARHKVAEGF